MLNYVPDPVDDSECEVSDDDNVTIFGGNENEPGQQNEDEGEEATSEEVCGVDPNDILVPRSGREYTKCVPRPRRRAPQNICQTPQSASLTPEKTLILNNPLNASLLFLPVKRVSSTGKEY